MRFRLAWGFVVIGSALPLACATAVVNDSVDDDGGGSALPDASTSGSDAYGGSTDAAKEAAVDAGPSCTDGGTACGAACVDTTKDLKNCGGCGKACVGADAACTGTGTSAGCSAVLHASALIDGESQLVIQGSTAHWHHIDHSPPGLWNGNDAPTVLDGVNWTPTWSTGTSCTNCDSSSTTVTPLAAKPQTVTLKAIGRDSLTITQQPSAANGYTLIIDFNDDSSGGGANYEADVLYQTS